MEILHKAKRVDNGEWVEGFYCRYQPHASEEKYVYGIVPSYASAMYVIPVNPETVCAYIGKNDGKSNKIWEHDILSINTYSYMEPEEDFFGEVVYCEAWACWCIKQPEEEKPIPLCECEGSYMTKIEILGNRFDNPEILEV